jgi:hypothetical protein
LANRTLFNSTVKVLGLGNTYASIIASSAIALVSFFYLYTVASYLKISTYILENRVIYIDTFDNYIVNEFTDYIIINAGIALWFLLCVKGNGRFYISSIFAGLTIIGVLAQLEMTVAVISLTSIPLVVSFIFYNRYAPRRILSTNPNLAVNYLGIIGIVVGVASISISLMPVLSVSPSLAYLDIHNYAYEVFVLLSKFSPLLMFLLIFCLPVKLLINQLAGILLKTKNFNDTIVSSSVSRANTAKSRTKIICVTSFILLSIILVLIPHQPTINKNNQQIGVDTHYYVNWVGALIKSKDIQELMYQAFVIQGQNGDRPIALIFLFALVKVVNSADPSYIYEHTPIILGPALVLVVYFLTRELTSNDVTSLFASFLTSVSFQMLVGIYSGYYANWIALIFSYLSAVFLIRFLKTSGNLNLIVFCMLIVISLLTHVYTWVVTVVVFIIFLGIILITKYYHRKRVIVLLLAILLSIAIDITRATIIGSSGGIERDIEIATEEAGLQQFNERWNTLNDVIQIYVGGQFSNFIILVLCLYWLFFCDLQKTHNIFIIIFLSIGIMPLFFGDWHIQLRVLYNIPFQIPAAIALTYLYNQVNTFRIYIPVCIIWLIAISIRSVSNFYLILPT